MNNTILRGKKNINWTMEIEKNISKSKIKKNKNEIF